jgi:predicted MFS family arabinose efflux permease
VLIGISWFGVGGVFLMAAATGALAGLVLLRLPPGSPRGMSQRSPVGEMVDAFRYVRARHELGLIAMITIGVVVIAFPYLTFLPTLADDRYDVGAGGYGIMAGVAGLGAVVAGTLAPRVRTVQTRPWAAIGAAGAVLGVALIVLGLAGTFWSALAVLLVVGAAGLIFQTTTQSLMLSLSDIDYHGRMQSMVVLGFSGFGLAALPLGLLADAVTLRVTLVAMGAVVLVMTAAFARRRQRYRRRGLATEFV